MQKVALLFLPLLLFSGLAKGEDKGKPLDTVFKGKIVSLKDGKISIKYDFSDKSQMDDWFVTKPFKVAGSMTAAWENKAVRLKGVGAFCMKAMFRDDVSLEFDVKPWSDRNFGAVVYENLNSNQFLLFSVNDLYFQKFDGAHTPGHMVTRFGVKDQSIAKGDVAFRYIARSTTPKIQKFKVLHLKAVKNGTDESFSIGKKTMSGVGSMGRKLLDVHIGVYSIHCQMIVDSVTVTGKLAADWLKKNHISLTLTKPLAPVKKADEAAAATAAAAAAARAKIDKFSAGDIKAVDLLPVVSDADLPRPVREDAEKAIAGSGDKSVVRYLVPLLYSGDETTRELTYDLVHKLVGRTFGYNPKAGADKRSNAIRKLVKYLEKHSGEFG